MFLGAGAVRALEFCEGRSKVHADWPGPAESTIRSCGVLVYHSLAMGIYPWENPPHGIYRPQVWLQSGDIKLKHVVWNTQIRTSCQRPDGSFYWRDCVRKETTGQAKDTSFIQKYGPDIDMWELDILGGDCSYAKCAADIAGTRYIVTFRTTWNIKYDECDFCVTKHYVDKGRIQ